MRRDQKTVAHITTVHHPRDPRIFYKQLQTLQRAGYNVQFVAPESGSGPVDGISIVGISSLAQDRAASYWRRFRAQPEVFWRAWQCRADLYHIHDPELLPLAYLLHLARGVPVVYDMHEDFASQGGVRGRFIRMMETWAFSWLQHVILAETSYREIISEEPVEATLIANYARSSSHQVKEDNEPPKAPSRLLYTGTVADERGLGTMLDVMEQVRERGRPERLRMVGVCHRSGERTTALRRLRRLDGTASWVGDGAYVDATEMPPHYRWADVGLVLCRPTPNLRRSLPTKFFEYLQYGLPILCTDVPLWRDFVERHACGTVVPANDSDAVLDVLLRWRNEPERYRSYAENARAAASQYRWEEMGGRLSALYDRLLEDSGPTG